MGGWAVAEGNGDERTTYPRARITKFGRSYSPSTLVYLCQISWPNSHRKTFKVKVAWDHPSETAFSRWCGHPSYCWASCFAVCSSPLKFASQQIEFGVWDYARLSVWFSERSMESLQFYKTNIFSLPLWDRVGGFELQWAQFTLAETTRLVAPSGEWLRDESCGA